ncbi:ribosome-associated protein [Eubacterium multiforme]|uniref:Ribosome-associated protein n=2 Tax=Eubacterium multiforme TaxID=83339 RepID=A0ABT9UXQ5_9FIRM|nr:ribosome-associated protein [Eubacterium multiforme]
MYKYTKFIHEYPIFNMKEININTEFIKLDSFLKWAGVASLGSEAKIYISEEMVKVNGEVCTQRGKKLRSGDIIEFEEEKYKII